MALLPLLFAHLIILHIYGHHVDRGRTVDGEDENATRKGPCGGRRGGPFVAANEPHRRADLPAEEPEDSA